MTTKTLKQIILTADKGMCLTDGNGFYKSVILPESVDPSIYHEITLAEYEETSAAKQAEVQDVNY